ncbi:MAG: hypothetical protein DMG63_19500 [Acidobacteria bacterium]|nr:MAG: hypothetical protein DMG63_19500 [Acidobacteriota bacterium]
MLSLAASGIAQVPPSWTEPFPPHHIVGNVYYVGSKGLASYLITTSEGSILINSSLESSVPLIQSSVEKLGFRFNDIKILLISHAHWDHAAGSTQIKKLTGAKYMVMEGDVDVVESGGKTDLVNNPKYPEIASDYERTFRVLKSLPCDIFLGAHGDYYGMEAKFAKMKKKSGDHKAFVDPNGYKNYVKDREQAFRAEWRKQMLAVNRAP